MLVLIQLIALLLCGILAVLAFMLANSNSFHDEKGDKPFTISATAFVFFMAALIGVFAVFGIGEKIREDMDRAETQLMIDNLRRSAQGL